MDVTLATHISLNDLEKGCPGITSTIGKFLCEATKTCLDNQKHISGVKILLEGIPDGEYQINWIDEVDEQVRRAWNDEIEMTAFGACGIAVLLVLKFTEYTILERARIGTGIDYWLSKKSSDLPFQNSARLEVSGILNGNRSVFNSRVNQKLKQTHPTDEGSLPAYVIVVEFSEPKAKMVMK